MSNTKPSKQAAGWIPKRRDRAWVWAPALAGVILGGAAIVASLDQAGLTHSPICGPRCEDTYMEAALSAPQERFIGRYRLAREAGMRQVAMRPFDAGAWLRLCLLEIKAGQGRMTPAARDAFAMSYERAPVDAVIAPWRIPLAFDHWQSLSPPTRQAVMDEVRVIYQAPQNRPGLRQIVRKIHDFDGGFAYLMLLEALDDAAYREPVRDAAPARETPTPTPKMSDQTPAIAGT